MALKIVYQAATGEFDKAMRGIYRPIAEAGTAAMAEAVAEIKTKGRADIAAAGFGKKWQNTFRVDQYPKRKASANAAALIYHRIPYADIFETGGAIAGKPTLWIPLSSSPQKIGRRRFTPRNYIKEVGRLTPIHRAGKPPLLAGKMAVTERQAATGTTGKITLGKLRGGASSSGPTRLVPLFVGIKSVKLRDRFSLREITNRAAAALPALYAKHLNAEG